MTPDVIVVGGGPAGSIAAAVLARAGARVVVFDRARFPRPKLCGDTVNPGALEVLERLGLHAAVSGGLHITGMVVTGEPAVRVAAGYPAGTHGVALTRAVLDDRLLHAAADAGARVEEGALVRGAVLDDEGRRVIGVELARPLGRDETIRAPVVIAADGHFSRVARPLRLSRSARTPRRWAVGAYFEGVDGLEARGEMHVRRTHYIGVAPLAGGLANACLVTADARLLRGPDPLHAILASDPWLRDRFMRARRAGPTQSLGPLAVDASAAGMPGLLLAGDAAGFIDPITGDGLRFAFRGAELAAGEALRALREGWQDTHERLARVRLAEFGGKWRFNRTLRRLVALPLGVRAAGLGATIAPVLLRRVIQYAGDAL